MVPILDDVSFGSEQRAEGAKVKEVSVQIELIHSLLKQSLDVLVIGHVL